MNKLTASLLNAALLAAMMLAGGCSKPPESAAPTPAITSSVGNVSDEHVKTALQQSELLKAFDINVVTLKGDVRLIGMLDNQAQVDEAIKIARAADGAHTIHDELTLKR